MGAVVSVLNIAPRTANSEAALAGENGPPNPTHKLPGAAHRWAATPILPLSGAVHSRQEMNLALCC